MAHRGYETYHHVRPEQVVSNNSLTSVITSSNRHQRPTSDHNFVTVGAPDGSFNFGTIEEALAAIGCGGSEPNERRLRETARRNNVIPTILIYPGRYQLPCNLGDAPINFQGAGFDGRPSVIVTGNTESGGNKNWAGIRFEDVEYKLGERSDGREQFVNTTFTDRSTISSCNSSLVFIGSNFDYDELPKRPVVSVEGRSHLVLNECKVRSARNERRSRSRSRSRNRSDEREERVPLEQRARSRSRSRPRSRSRSHGHSRSRSNSRSRNNAIFRLRATNGDTRIEGTSFEATNNCLSDSKSENHYLFDVGSSQPIYFQNNIVRMSSNHGRLFVFGSNRSCDSVALEITNSTFTNRAPENPFVGIVANLWARTQRTDLFGSITIDSCIGNSVIPFWYDDVTRHWPQNLSLSNSTFNAAGTSTAETSSLVYIEQPPASTWQLTITNTKMTGRNVIPIVIESVTARNSPITSNGGENFTLNVANSFFQNLAVPSVGEIPWLRVSGLTNFIINIDVGSSRRGFGSPEFVSNGTITQNVNPALL